MALDALDENERAPLAAEVAADAELRRELEAWRETVAQLAYLAPAAEPAPDARAKILNAIKTGEQNNAQNVAPRAIENVKVSRVNDNQPRRDFADARKFVASPDSNAAQFQVRAAPRRSFARYFPFAGAVAASLVAILLGVALANSASQLQIARDEIAALNQKNVAAEQKLNELTARLERERQERDLLASPSSIVRALSGTKEMPTAKARLVFDRASGRALLFVENLPDAPAGKAYQIWWIADPKQPAPGGTFKTSSDGKGELRDLIPPQYTSAPVFAVTLEPETGSQKPSGSPILITSVS